MVASFGTNICSHAGRQSARPIADYAAPVPLLPPLVVRARGHARRFPRPFWVLIGASAVGSFGAGLFVSYWALYLTDERGASGAQAGALLALAGGMGLVGAPLGGILADRLGRRSTLLLSLAGSAVGLILYGAL